ncbi:hypothetical protein [Streptomyces sp. NPDC059949]|uniref:hypothetical protein n=1 Tax=Streptomyces sp. NPDC059949 TaxID=3347013 RepID=UPI003659C59A
MLLVSERAALPRFRRWRQADRLLGTSFSSTLGSQAAIGRRDRQWPMCEPGLKPPQLFAG